MTLVVVDTVRSLETQSFLTLLVPLGQLTVTVVLFLLLQVFPTALYFMSGHLETHLTFLSLKKPLGHERFPLLVVIVELSPMLNLTVQVVVFHLPVVSVVW